MRRRVIYGLVLIAVVMVGLLSRKHPALFPAVLGKYPGDALWAIMVFCGLGFIQPCWSTGKRAMYALLISYADELSQIYQAPWINRIRATTLGHLILGATFSWWDMLAYTVGIAIAAAANAYQMRNSP